jgi:broad specificity phosphatase PhoE
MANQFKGSSAGIDSFVTLEHLVQDDSLRVAEFDEIKKAQAVVVRHANSAANAGVKTNLPNDIPLTEVGQEQAEYLAEFLDVPPTKIIHSPYIRTKLTADPTIAKFPEVEVVEWPIQEFTYLNPANHIGTTLEERKVVVDKYWNNADPEYRDGGAAESFVDLWKRVEIFRERVERLTSGALVFSHGQFMRMLMFQMEYGNITRPDRVAMQEFRLSEQIYKVANTARIAILSASKLGQPKVSHLPKKLIT